MDKPSDHSTNCADIPSFLNEFAARFADELRPDTNNPEWQRVQAPKENITRYARTSEFKVKLGMLNDLIDQADLESEGHGMSKDLAKLVDEMEVIIVEALKVSILHHIE